jgi:hypothetical protein
VEVQAFLCNHAEVQNNLLYAMGIGVDRTFIPPGPPAPWPVTIAIGISVTVPWTATNQQHTVHIDLVDADGQPVNLPTGQGTTGPFEAALQFNVGRPPDLRVGDAQLVNLAITMPGLPMPALGDYKFRISIDGSVERELAYRLVSAQVLIAGPGQMPPA